MARTELTVLLTIDHDDDVTDDLLKKGVVDELEGLTVVDFRAGAVNHGTAVIDEAEVERVKCRRPRRQPPIEIGYVGDDDDDAA